MHVFVQKKSGKFPKHQDVPSQFACSAIAQNPKKAETWQKRFPQDDRALFEDCAVVLAITRKSTRVRFPQLHTPVRLFGPGIPEDRQGQEYIICRTAWKRKRLYSGIIGLMPVL